MEKHGMHNTKIYRRWADMLQRCNNPKSNNYKYYGLKGVRVCKEWHKFENFYYWSLDNGYKEGLSIDRINPRGNYEPNNCRWVTRKEQDNNRTNSLFVEIKGEKMTLKQASEKFGINYKTMQFRYRSGDRGEKLIEPTKRGVKRNGEKRIPDDMPERLERAQNIKWLLKNTNLKQIEIAELTGVTQGLVTRIKCNKTFKGCEEKRPVWYENE